MDMIKFKHTIEEGENYSIPLLLPKTVLTVGEYLEIMDRL